MGAGWRAAGNGEGVKKYRWAVTKQSQGVAYSAGKRSNNVVVTTCDCLGTHCVTYIKVEPLHCTPEANIVSDVTCD